MGIGVVVVVEAAWVCVWTGLRVSAALYICCICTSRYERVYGPACHASNGISPVLLRSLRRCTRSLTCVLSVALDLAR